MFSVLIGIALVILAVVLWLGGVAVPHALAIFIDSRPSSSPCTVRRSVQYTRFELAGGAANDAPSAAAGHRNGERATVKLTDYLLATARGT